MYEQLLLSFYGDDLTGSTDAMEALSLAGIENVLFVRPPSDQVRARFAGARAVGLAGTSRSQTPMWMTQHLPEVFKWLRGQGAPICHYKVCSTFDSSPAIGSIGCALDIGADVFEQTLTPLVVGVPQLKRYTCFGHLFAAYQGTVYRIDRHPVMSRHPVTPMPEADLRVHLGRQTSKSIGVVELPDLSAPNIDSVVQAMFKRYDVVLFDVADATTQLAAGQQLWRLAAPEGRFVVGSSGVEYALIRSWGHDGLIGEPTRFEPPGKAKQIAVVSGSVSPTTERQIRQACTQGFDLQPIAPGQLLSEEGVSWAVEHGLKLLAQGRSAIIATALGPSSSMGLPEDARHEVGRRLGAVLNELVGRAQLDRAVVAGGDTSSHALQALQVVALTTRLPLPMTPGSPLCRTHRADGTIGPELAFKGGQIGGDNYFANIRDGIA